MAYGVTDKEPTDFLVLNLRLHDDLSDREAGILASLPAELRLERAGKEFVAIGSRPRHSCLIVKGLAGRVQNLASGSRQITAIHLSGDFVDLHSFLLKTMDHGVVALTDCEIALVPHASIRRITETEPHLTRLLWLSTLVDAAIYRAWLGAMGQRSAEAQLAHLVCELFLRHKFMGLTEDNRFALPLTQEVLGEILGKSTVHVNRALQSLRRANLLTWQSRVVTILDWDRLAELAEFDPGYLNYGKEPR